MKFYSFIFLFFIIIAVVVYYSLPNKYRKFSFLVFNYLFYSYFDYRLAILLFGLTTLNYVIGNLLLTLKIDKTKSILFSAAIVTNILGLGFFKYFNFFIESINDFNVFLGLNLNISTLQILLPLGISYYTFQTMTYVFDIYYGNIDKKYSFIEYAVFASFFPTIIAGPIERASTLLPQINKLQDFDLSFIKKGIALITIGMIRKLLIADPAGVIVNQIFSEPQYYRSFEILIAILLYPFQLYNDFAGYSSIARGIAKLFGFDIISNFKQPFFATSITDFWRRWHISFSFWLRDYLFTPLQLKFRNLGLFGNIWAVMITFIICGLWHGPSWSNVSWGFIQGVYISFSLITIKYRENILSKFNLNESLQTFIKILFTFLLTVVGFFIARADNIPSAIDMISRIIIWTPSDIALRFLSIFLFIALFTFLIDLSEIKYKSQAFLKQLNPQFRYALYLILWGMIILSIITQNKLPFIYEKF